MVNNAIADMVTVEQVVNYMWQHYRAVVTIAPQPLYTWMPNHGPRYMAEFTRSWVFSDSGETQTKSGFYHAMMIDAIKDAANDFIVSQLPFNPEWVQGAH